MYEELFHQPSSFAYLPDLPSKADGLNNQAVSYVYLGRTEDAVRYWQQALQDTPHHLEATFNYGYWRWQQGEIPDDAHVAQMWGLESSSGTDPDYWRCLAWMHLERGDLEAVERIQQSEYRVEDDGFKKAFGDDNKPVGRSLWTLEGHTHYVESVCFSPDGRYALSGSWDCTLRLWEVASGQEVRCFKGHTSPVISVGFSLDGRYALSGSRDQTLRLWEVASGREVRCWYTDSVGSVCFSPDGRYALLGCWDQPLRLWEVASGQEVRYFEGHTSPVESVCFSPDGRYALSGSWDQTLRLWEVASGREVRCLKRHTASVQSVCFSSDGRYALSGSDDRTLQLWEFDWEWTF